MRREAPVPDPEAPIPTETVPTETDTESSADPAVAAAPVATESATSDEREFRWLVIAAVGAVLAVIVAFIVITGGKPKQLTVDEVGQALQARVEPGGTMTTFTQPTDHPIRLPATSAGLQWGHLTGRWGTLRSRAYVYRPAEAGVASPPPPGAPAAVTVVPAPSNDSLLIVNMTNNGTAEVVLDEVAPGAGLVFRLQDTRNYLAVAVAPDGNGWEFVRVRNGVIETEPIAADPPQDGAYLSVAYNGPAVEVSADGKSIYTTTATDWPGARVGLIVRGPEGSGPDGAMFDNFLTNPAAGGVAGVPPSAPSATSATVPVPAP